MVSHGEMHAWVGVRVSEASAVANLLIVRPQDVIDFALDEADKGLGKQVVGITCRVVEVGVRMSQDLKQRLHQLLVLRGGKMTTYKITAHSRHYKTLRVEVQLVKL